MIKVSVCADNVPMVINLCLTYGAMKQDIITRRGKAKRYKLPKIAI